MEESDRASYTSGNGELSVTAWRLQDPTGALAAYQWQRPREAAPSKLTQWSVATDTSATILHRNYVLQFEGRRPDKATLDALVASLPKVRTSSMPPLLNYVPSERVVRNSERYLLGPASLAQFEPRLPAGVVGFHMGAEGIMARYATPAGEASLVIFSYPTPHMARERLKEFEHVTGGAVKRTGHLVAVAMGVPEAEAKALVGRVSYQQEVTWNEEVPKDPGNPGEMIQAIVTLAGALIVSSVILGLFLGGFKQMLARFGMSAADERLTELHLSKR